MTNTAYRAPEQIIHSRSNLSRTVHHGAERATVWPLNRSTVGVPFNAASDHSFRRLALGTCQWHSVSVGQLDLLSCGTFSRDCLKERDYRDERARQVVGESGRHDRFHLTEFDRLLESMMENVPFAEAWIHGTTCHPPIFDRPEGTNDLHGCAPLAPLY